MPSTRLRGSPFFVNNARHPHVPALLAADDAAALGGSTLGGGEAVAGSMNSDPSVADRPDSANPDNAGVAANAVTRSQANTPADAGAAIARWTARTLIEPGAAVGTAPLHANYAPKPKVKPADAEAVADFVSQRQSVVRFVRDALQSAADRQKAAVDKRGRKNMNMYRVGDRVLLSTDGIKNASVTNLGASKLAPRFIGPFRITKVLGDAYALGIPTTRRLHPTFYVGRLKPYHEATIPDDGPVGPSTAARGDEALRPTEADIPADAPSSGRARSTRPSAG